MAKCTHISLDQAKSITKNFAELGSLHRISFIAGGAQNSNYQISTKMSEYILTIIEDQDILPLDFIIDLLRIVNERTAVPVPVPIPTREGNAWSTYRGKLALITARLPGTHPTRVTAEHVAAIGRAQGEIHSVSAAYQQARTNARSFDWWSRFLNKLPQRASLHPEELSIIRRITPWRHGLLQRPSIEQLPRGIVHGDLFRDNTLFRNSQLTGVLDFFAACRDVFVYDIALSINEWCLLSKKNGDKLVPILMEAYQSVRPLTEPEIEILPDLQRLAAFHTWAYRLYLRHRAGRGEQITAKDPKEYEELIHLLEKGADCPK